jgi:Fur family transcriptional regulator, ferric uptake regulator
MPDITLTPDAVLSRLRGEGMRVTGSRRSILDVLFEAERPLSLPEIQERAFARGEKPDYATVFRMMTLLERLHLVHKVNLQRSCSYYELHDPAKHYDHIVCTLCGKVVVIDIPCPLGETEQRIAAHYGFTNLTHSLEFFGRCPECAAA